ncbi:hypothetical protein FQN60_000719 [Etheostoma spectabile]|uniref:Uncharacterized protein n=1 Tax=Etheostoma spectabile TaxID=54343 RepID=A0A5J5D142_9PERO|nr:hypothetical protein FQN60_000719 [Etheostoma spectabile]
MQVNCLLSVDIFSGRLLSKVFLKYKINKLASWICTELVSCARFFNNQRNIFTFLAVRTCDCLSVKLQARGSLLPSVRIHFNSSLYSSKCLASIFQAM